MDKTKNKSNKDTIINIYQSDSDHDQTLQNNASEFKKDIRNNCIYVSILLGLALIMILYVNCNFTWINNIYHYRQILSSTKDVAIQECWTNTPVMTTNKEPGKIVGKAGGGCKVEIEATKQRNLFPTSVLYLNNKYTEEEWVPGDSKGQEIPDEIWNCKEGTNVRYIHKKDHLNGKISLEGVQNNPDKQILGCSFQSNDDDLMTLIISRSKIFQNHLSSEEEEGKPTYPDGKAIPDDWKGKEIPDNIWNCEVDTTVVNRFNQRVTIKKKNTGCRVTINGHTKDADQKDLFPEPQ